MTRGRGIHRCLVAALLVATLGVSGMALAPHAQAATNGDIFFASARDGNLDIWAVDPDAPTNGAALTDDLGSDSSPAVSADANTVAFVSDRDSAAEPPKGDIFVMDADGASELNLTNSSDVDDNEPAFSPDGTTIVFVRDSRLWSMNATDGSSTLQLTDDSQGDSSPSFSPDGSKIAFARGGQLWSMDADGENETQIQSSPGNPIAGTESNYLPDGRVLFRGTDNHIRVVGADGSGETAVTSGSEIHTSPAPSPDGLRVAFTEVTFITVPVFAIFTNVRVIDIDGSDGAAMTTTGVDLAPAWSDVPAVTVPTPTITSHPGPATTDTTPSFSFTASGGTGFECTLHLSGGSDSFSSCTSTYTSSALADGNYVFKVRALEGAVPGNPAAHSFAVDTTGPVATITPSQNSPTNDTTPSFTFSFNEATGSGTEMCSMRPTGQSDAFASCSSPFTASPALSEGTHVFKVQANDTLGNVGSAASSSVTVDTTGPLATITPSQGTPTNDTTPTFGYSYGETVSGVQCAVTASGGTDSYGSCSTASAHTPSALADDTYAFKVRATDAAGNQRVTTSSDFTVDTVGPLATITPSQGTPTNDTTPTFGYSYSESVTGVQCVVALTSVANPTYGSCTSGSSHTPSALADGTYTFRVRATDTTGNQRITTSSAFTVDTVGPLATITPSQGTPTNDPTPTFGYSHGETVSGVQCAVTASGGTDSYGSCSTGSAHTPSALADGTYAFKVRATDAAGNQRVTTSSDFTVDTVGPQATITPSQGTPTNDTTPTFDYSYGETVSGVQCAVTASGGADAFVSCSSGTSHTPPPLGDGTYTFKVRASDAAGNQRVSMSSAFVVDATGPSATITPSQTSPTNVTTPAFGYSYSESVTGVECALTASGSTDVWGSCTTASSHTATALVDGSYAFKVRATDAIGNQRVTSASFTVDTVGPVVTVTGKKRTRDRTPSFTIASDATTLTCQADTKPATACAAGKYTTPKLKPGKRFVTITGTDAAGNVTTVVKKITILV